MAEKPFVIAEVGCNHKGDMEIAKKHIQIAAHYCGVSAVKFQKRRNRELLTAEQYNAPHPNPANAYGATYGAHREFLEFNKEQHAQLKLWCEEAGVIYSTSVWDMTSAREIAELNPVFIKIPSACNNNLEMLGFLCDEYQGEIHASLGMTTRNEEDKLVKLFEAKDRAQDLTLYACTSGYPVPYHEVSLLEIRRLIEKFGCRVKAIGFSGHHIGTAPDIAALALGASVFERHFTLNRQWKGTDHAASLEPEGMKRLVGDLRDTAQALTYKPEEVTDIEIAQRAKLKYRKNR